MHPNAQPTAQPKPARPRGTLGLKRVLPSALPTTNFASPSRTAPQLFPSITPAKRARLVLPTQHFDHQDAPTNSPIAATPTDHTPPSHAFLLGRNSPNYGTNTAATPESSSRTGPFYLCTWRKPQTKKNKTWDGDAILAVKDGGERCSLICSQTGKELVGSARFAFNLLSSGDELALGGKEIEIDRQIDAAEYRNMIAFTRGDMSPLKKGPPPTAVRTPKPFVAPTKCSAVVSLDVNQIAPARTESFYGKPAPRPIRNALDDDDDNDDPSASRSASPSRVSGLINPGQGKQAHPRFDPNEPGAIVMSRPDEQHQRKYNHKKLPIVDVVLDPSLSKALRPHQIQGIKFLYDRVTGMQDCGGKGYGAILADEMGLGKTLQTIALILTLMKQCCYYTPRSCTIQRAMIVCPLTLVKNWKREFRKWIGNNSLNVLCIDEDRGREDVERFVRSKAYHVLVIGYEKLRSVMDVVKTAQPPIDLLVCDEGHRLKNAEAKTTQMFNELSVQRKIILSGTPIQNDLRELYAMLDFVVPDMFASYDAFKITFEEPIMRSRAKHCSKQVKATGQARLNALMQITKDIMLRRTADILSKFLPPKKEMVLFCSPAKEQLQIYQSILGSSDVRDILSGHAGNGLLQIGVLRKLCNSPELLLKDSESYADNPTKALVGDISRFFRPNFVRNESRLSGKFICVMNILESVRATTDDKVVLVSNFTSTLDIVEAMMRKKRYSYLRLDGKTPQDERMAMVNRFNREGVDNSFVFLLSAKSGGVGLNLIGANRLVLIDSDWNPSTDLQAMARIHRDGQKKTCYIYRLLLSGTMDEKIYQRQISKLGLSDSLMNAEKKSSSDTFSQEELKDIFTLHLDSTCISHRQLICDCGGKGGSASVMLEPSMAGESQHLLKSQEEEEDEEEEEEEDDVLPGFIAASQHVVSEAAKDKLDKRKKLLALYKWAHYDCVQYPDAFIEDEIVSEIMTKVSKVGIRAEAKLAKPLRVKREQDDEWRSNMKERGDDVLLSDESEDDDAELDSTADRGFGGEDEFRMDRVEAGRILFVFVKKSDNTTVNAVEPAIAPHALD
ncbi:related to RAD54 - DNA-dependent ATPase of the Snf2p family [Melanopsichium pennsylvanicum]|uniref:Related to RAD54 - DNA-dependent ATPase of the Snf2p family n=2 Tax=Melanopsichium pennsylvanicum TaxID=63383 RepID=A0AAJ4XMJ2_9BASI|nr:related to RAD54-DNA-dependent ATPase of the Snf2p family [Melanopsichium pennsylvanicum 4]SNX85325.1 related to RAD54 - DNA-dependent ATPase of the Snf2p family [Melanopsichium pennsylvanicum]